MLGSIKSAFSNPLSSVEQRVLGALMEKEIATPEQYPLSLNALINACNQRSSRDPVMDLTEPDIREALADLEARALVSATRDARVTKYEHRARTVLNLRRDETAILCLLLLRGPQTPGELRARADRLYTFDDLAAVQSTIDRMAGRQPAGAEERPQDAPLTLQLSRQPGSREARYIHLLGDVASIALPASEEIHAPRNRIEELQEEVASLKAQIGTLAGRIQALEDSRRTALP